MIAAARSALRRLHQLLCHFGLDPLVFGRALVALPGYLRDLVKFSSQYSGQVSWVPRLHDKNKSSGDLQLEYFVQDLMVAQWIHAAKPRHHLDVGSRVDGFVAHIASFMDIEVLDVRPPGLQASGIKFFQVDLLNTPALQDFMQNRSRYQSLSCLHVLEHFGLGRYGDRLDVLGPKKGFMALARMLEPGGTLYLSVPLGRERVEFNSSWVFSPHTIIKFATAAHLEIRRLVTICPRSGHYAAINVDDENALGGIDEADYLLGIFVIEAGAELHSAMQDMAGEPVEV